MGPEDQRMEGEGGADRPLRRRWPLDGCDLDLDPFLCSDREGDRSGGTDVFDDDY
jgi:hypothetical protein